MTCFYFLLLYSNLELLWTPVLHDKYSLLQAYNFVYFMFQFVAIQ